MFRNRKPSPQPAAFRRRADLNETVMIALTQIADSKLQEDKSKNIRFAVMALILFLGFVGYIGSAAFFAYKMGDKVPSGGYASMIRITGPITAGGPNSANNLIPALERAFKDEKAKGVVLLVNSPGGSPVQANIIRDHLLKLQNRYPNKPLVAVSEDIMASAAYLIAVGSPEIYANRSSLVGSIGVIMSHFAYPKIMDRYGIERRVYTAGKLKSRFDPYKPVKPVDQAKAQEVLHQVHTHFIDAVLATRKSKITVSQDKLFSGDYWVGEKAQAMGLVDGLADLKTVIATKYGVEEVRDYTPTPNFFEKMGSYVGGSIGTTITSQMGMEQMPQMW